MPESHIGSQFFQQRLQRLCLAGGTTALPRSPQDRHILFKSMQLLFEPGREYTEPQVNVVLERWRGEIAGSMDCDHVTLRRLMVDHGYLVRRSDGSCYLAGDDGGRFAADVGRLDPIAMIRDARVAMIRRKARFTGSQPLP